jgi:hypothetical protein
MRGLGWLAAINGERAVPQAGDGINAGPVRKEIHRYRLSIERGAVAAGIWVLKFNA